jgi:hypothetical protein
MDVVTTAIGFCLFVISEVMSLMPVNGNGLLHSLLLGFRDAFSNQEKDIEMAKKFVTNPTVASIVNTVSSNPAIKSNIDLVLQNPQVAHILSMIGANSETLNTLTNLMTNQRLLALVKNLANDPQLSNNVLTLTDNPNSLSNVISILQNTQAMTLINNKNALNSLSNNNSLISTLPYITSQNAINLQYLVADQTLANTVYNLNNSSQKPVLLNMVDALLTQPELVPNMSSLVTQAITPSQV